MFDATPVSIRRSFNDNLTQLNLGPHITLYFSYETVIAFSVSGEGTFKSENVWSRTTQRHLNDIYGHTLAHDEFEKRLGKLMSKVGTAIKRVPRTISN